MESEHYIPLTSSASESSTNFNVAILGSKKWKNRLSKPGDIASKDFRQKALFNPHIRRVPSKFFVVNTFFKLVSSFFVWLFISKPPGAD